MATYDPNGQRNVLIFCWLWCHSFMICIYRDIIILYRPYDRVNRCGITHNSNHWIYKRRTRWTRYNITSPHQTPHHHSCAADAIVLFMFWFCRWSGCFAFLWFSLLSTDATAMVSSACSLEFSLILASALVQTYRPTWTCSIYPKPMGIFRQHEISAWALQLQMSCPTKLPFGLDKDWQSLGSWTGICLI